MANSDYFHKHLLNLKEIMMKILQNFTQRKGKSRHPVLDNFWSWYHAIGRGRQTGSIIGRENEIERVSQILSRRKENNQSWSENLVWARQPLWKVLHSELSKKLVGPSLIKDWSCWIWQLVAGCTKYRGQFEEGWKYPSNLKNPHDVILFYWNPIPSCVLAVPPAPWTLLIYLKNLGHAGNCNASGLRHSMNTGNILRKMVPWIADSKK